MSLWRNSEIVGRPCHGAGKLTPSFEVEATLAICAAQPAIVAADIAEQTSIADYLAQPVGTVMLQDAYLDLPDASLRSREMGMRIRTIGKHTFLTLKGPPEAVDGGGVCRLEVEEAWSDTALATVVDYLAEYGVVVGELTARELQSDPLEVMSALGFLVEQTRTTTRRALNVAVAGKLDSVLAEMAVDAVVYHLAVGDVTHHEVEIEIKGNGDIGVMQRVTSALLKQWPDSLRIWNYGKRSTGRAIDALCTEVPLSGLVGDDGVLKPRAYDAIAKYLE